MQAEEGREEDVRLYGELYGEEEASRLVLTSAQLDDRAEVILTKKKLPQLGGLTVKEALDQEKWAAYVGTTGQAKVEMEDLRWLTQNDERNNRAVLLDSGGGIIREKEAREVYGFKSIILDINPLRINIQGLERRIHEALHHLLLGGRLHRALAAANVGVKIIADDHRFGRTMKLFVTVIKVEGRVMGEGGVIIEELVVAGGRRMRVMP